MQNAGEKEEDRFEVKSNIQKAQKKQKMYNDRKHGASSSLFNVGSLVLKKDYEKEKVENWIGDGWVPTRFLVC